MCCLCVNHCGVGDRGPRPTRNCARGGVATSKKSVVRSCHDYAGECFGFCAGTDFSVGFLQWLSCTGLTDQAVADIISSPMCRVFTIEHLRWEAYLWICLRGRIASRFGLVERLCLCCDLGAERAAWSGGFQSAQHAGHCEGLGQREDCWR